MSTSQGEGPVVSLSEATGEFSDLLQEQFPVGKGKFMFENMLFLGYLNVSINMKGVYIKSHPCIGKFYLLRISAHTIHLDKKSTILLTWKPISKTLRIKKLHFNIA